ncbi:MAG TPA: 23S rRNA (cytidine(2498)-2'-O)-methyltransferase RlmM [Pseudomonadota bacterium]|nr:23S rRNA (cytidine(2498)-2'-O)-methyltransferase RlmM [Pseudomonadota bacterium]HNO69940.1 23S rRNA (cytidine(2498)-2'-O)-methyltransferase RlmM [Pseudomonadota bacterium]
MLQRSAPSFSRPAPARREVPAKTATFPSPVTVGDWLWLCRQGAENDVCEELALYRLTAEMLAPALVRSAKKPPGDVLLTFARQGLPVEALLPPDAQAITAAMSRRVKRPIVIHVFAPDSDDGNRLSSQAESLLSDLTTLLRAVGIDVLSDGEAAQQAGGHLLQVCFLSADRVAVGLVAAVKAQSLFPGGRQRFRKPKDAPSRSARKLEEALAFSGHVPAAGEVCVDLGAAPGGWSQVLLERRCHVVAIDPGRLAPAIAKRVEHLRMNAFSFAPEIPADWVVCDMAYRPLEVAALLARWGRHRWAQFLIANFKLPMKKRVEMVGRIREILETGGWTGIKMRQLYHDREEVTVAAWRGFGRETWVGKRASEGEKTTENAQFSPKSPEFAPNRSQGTAKGPGRGQGQSAGKTGGRRQARGGQGSGGFGAKKTAKPERGKKAQPRESSRSGPKDVRTSRVSGRSKGHVRRP